MLVFWDETRIDANPARGRPHEMSINFNVGEGGEFNLRLELGCGCATCSTYCRLSRDSCNGVVMEWSSWYGGIAAAYGDDAVLMGCESQLITKRLEVTCILHWDRSVTVSTTELTETEHSHFAVSSLLRQDFPEGTHVRSDHQNVTVRVMVRNLFDDALP